MVNYCLEKVSTTEIYYASITYFEDVSTKPQSSNCKTNDSPPQTRLQKQKRTQAGIRLYINSIERRGMRLPYIKNSGIICKQNWLDILFLPISFFFSIFKVFTFIKGLNNATLLLRGIRFLWYYMSHYPLFPVYHLSGLGPFQVITASPMELLSCYRSLQCCNWQGWENILYMSQLSSYVSLIKALKHLIWTFVIWHWGLN